LPPRKRESKPGAPLALAIAESIQTSVPAYRAMPGEKKSGGSSAAFLFLSWILL